MPPRSRLFAGLLAHGAHAERLAPVRDRTPARARHRRTGTRSGAEGSHNCRLEARERIKRLNFVSCTSAVNRRREIGSTNIGTESVRSSKTDGR